ncbi:MAG: hypothetical protein AAF392_03675 [Bacteroidota bacterium]
MILLNYNSNNSKINTLYYNACRLLFAFLLLPVNAVGIDAIKLNLEEQRRYNPGIARQTIEITREGDLHDKLLQRQSIDRSRREVIANNQIKQPGNDIGGEKATKLLALNRESTDFFKTTQSDSEEEPPEDETKDESTISLAKITPEQLAKDAWEIHQVLSYHPPQVYDGNTVLCTALLSWDSSCNQYTIHKFAFFNTKKPSEEVKVKAIDLGYTVQLEEPSHAEGALLQFLASNPQYTHLVAMGCSRKHCKECHQLMQWILGPDYQDVSAVVDKAQVSQEAQEITSSEANLLDKDYIQQDILPSLTSYLKDIVVNKLPNNVIIPKLVDSQVGVMSPQLAVTMQKFGEKFITQSIEMSLLQTKLSSLILKESSIIRDEYARNYHIPNKLGNLLKDLTGTRVIGKGHYKIDDKKRRRNR